MSLVARLFALIAFALLVVAGGELINGLILRNNRLVEMRDNTAQLARIAELDMGRILEGTRQLLAALAKLPLHGGWDERACAILEATASSDFEYDHLVAVDTSGTIVCSSSGRATAGTKARDTELVDRIVKTAGFSVGSYGVGVTSGNEVFRVGYPVVDAAGTVTGAVYAGINVTWLNTAINQWKLGEKISIQITDRNGVLIAAHPDPRIVGKPVADDLKPFLVAANAGTTEVKEAGGGVRLYGYTPARDVDLTEGIAVFVGRDQLQIFSDINRSIWLNAAAVLAALLAAAIVEVVYVRRFLARPFQDLLTAAGHWRSGNWSVRSGAASGIPEFDRLSQAFDAMAAEVSTREQLLLQERDFSNALVGSLPGLFMLIDQQYRYVRWNENLSRLTAMDNAQLQGLDALAMVAPCDRDRARAKIDEGFAVGIAAFEGSVQAGKRDPRIVRFNGRTITRDGQPYLLVIGTDITERKRAEEANAEKTILLSSVINASPDVIIVKDKDLRTILCNETVARALGKQPEDLYGKTDIENGWPHEQVKGDPSRGIRGFEADDREALAGNLVHNPSDLGSVKDEVRTFDTLKVPLRNVHGSIIGVLGISRDVTERNRAEVALRQANSALQISAAVIENASEGVMVVDDTLQIESVNPAFEQITGYSVAQAVGSTPRILFSGRHDDSFFQSLHEMVDAKDHWRGEIWNRRQSGELYPQETSINALRDADGRIRHYASVFSDSTARNELEARLRELSSMDGLTSIANRRTFDEVLAQEWARALRDGLPLSVIMTDIDHFKLYNDRYGHPAGDDCLQRVASAIKGCAQRSSDLVARYGGEEFVAILPNALGMAGAVVAERMRASVAALALPHSASGTAAFVTISVGVATVIPQRSARAVDLVAAADRALYRAKDTGRNRVVSEIMPLASTVAG